jgi:hypothetical protein
MEAASASYVCVPKTRFGRTDDEVPRNGMGSQNPNALSRTVHRCVFVQGSVSSRSVIIARVRVQHTAQMRLSKNDHMV